MEENEDTKRITFSTKTAIIGLISYVILALIIIIIFMAG